MPVYILALLIGGVAGLRSRTPPAVISITARIGWLHLEGTWLAFLAAPITPYIASLLAIGELINDKLPKTPSRKAPPGFAARILMGALSGIAITMPAGSVAIGCALGALGAVAGTLGGYEARRRTANAVGKDLPVALIEDAIAVGGAFLIAYSLS